MNRVYIEPSKFTDLRSGEESFGWRAFDDHSQTYDSSWSKVDISDDAVAFLKRVMATSEDKALWAMLDFCGNFSQGINVGVTFIDWPELSLLLGFVPAQ
jgi:hypothetical protein